MPNKQITFKNPVSSEGDKWGPIVEDSLIVGKSHEGNIFNALGTFVNTRLDYFRRVNRDEAKELLERGGGAKEIR